MKECAALRWLIVLLATLAGCASERRLPGSKSEVEMTSTVAIPVVRLELKKPVLVEGLTLELTGSEHEDGFEGSDNRYFVRITDGKAEDALVFYGSSLQGRPEDNVQTFRGWGLSLKAELGGGTPATAISLQVVRPAR